MELIPFGSKYTNDLHLLLLTLFSFQFINNNSIRCTYVFVVSKSIPPIDLFPLALNVRCMNSNNIRMENGFQRLKKIPVEPVVKKRPNFLICLFELEQFLNSFFFI